MAENTDSINRRSLEAEYGRLSRIIEIADEAIISHDSRQNIVMFNQGAERIFGYSASEVLGKPLDILLPERFANSHRQHIKEFGQSPENSRSMRSRTEIYGLRKDRCEFPAEASISKLIIDGETIFTVFLRDITERKHIERFLRASEAKFRGILESAPDAIVGVHANGRIIVVNTQAEKLFGYNREELFGLPIETLLPDRYKAGHASHRAGYYSDPQTRPMGAGFDLYARRKDGSEFPAEISLSPLERDDGVMVTSAIRDISERKQMEVAPRQARDQLEARVKERTAELESANSQLQQEIAERKRVEALISASLEEKELLLKEIHHRVKNNLQIISSLLNLQSACLNDPRAAEVFKDCQNRVAAMALIHEQLYQSGNQSGVDLPNYIKLLCNDLLISYGADHSRIELTLDLKPIFVNIDTAIPCSLIITELVSNSLKHAFPNSRKGRINITLDPNDSDGFQLVVSDDGVGLPDGIDYRKTTSLGLRLVNALTAQLRGNIEFLSDGGTQVRINANSAK